MGRIARGWHLTKQSWAIVRQDRSLLVFPLIAGIAALIVIVILVGAGIALYDSTGSEPALVAVLVVGLYPLIVLSVFCNVALSACAARSLEGQNTTAGEGFAAARARLGPVLGWAGVQLVVGGLISALQAVLREGAGAIIGALIGSLANLAWNVASFFAIPLIALEGLGPMAALKRSLSLVRERWGEGVTGSFAIGGLVFLVAFLPGVALVVLGVAVSSSVSFLGAAMVVVGVAIFVVGALIQTALMAIFKVALYRFALEDRVVGSFERADLESAFKPRGRLGHQA